MITEKRKSWILSGLLLTICIGGHWLPVLGYPAILLAVILLLPVFRSKKISCKTVCPRRSFLDAVVGPVSRRSRMPEFLAKKITRRIVLVFFFGMLGIRLVLSGGQAGMVFVGMCTISTTVAVLLGVFYKPRTWCTVCPVGTGRKMVADMGRKAA